MVNFTMNTIENQTKQEILDYIKKNDGVFYGDIVMHFNYPKNTVLKHLLDLKEEGQIFKDNDGGQFKLI